MYRGDHSASRITRKYELKVNQAMRAPFYVGIAQ